MIYADFYGASLALSLSLSLTLSFSLALPLSPCIPAPYPTAVKQRKSQAIKRDKQSITFVFTHVAIGAVPPLGLGWTVGRVGERGKSRGGGVVGERPLLAIKI